MTQTPIAQRLQRRWSSLVAVAVIAFALTAVLASRRSRASDPAMLRQLLSQAVANLNQTQGDSRSRVDRFARELAHVEAVTKERVIARPLSADLISRLAAIRWELGVLRGDPAELVDASLVRIAAERAPRVPEIQLEMGQLLCKMGLLNEGLPLMRRAISLTPSIAGRVVAALEAETMDPTAVAASLPTNPEVTAALKGTFLAAGRGVDFLRLAEGQLPDADPGLLSAYGDACLELGMPDRLEVTLRGVSALKSAKSDAEALRQRSRAAHASGRPAQALAHAEAAHMRMPEDVGLIELVGQMAMSAGQISRAESALRTGLELAALQACPDGQRARLYRRLGQVLEAKGAPEAAVDAFWRAIDLNPAEPLAAERLRRLGVTHRRRDGH